MVEVVGKIIKSKINADEVIADWSISLTDLIFNQFNTAINKHNCKDKPWVIESSKNETLLYGQVEMFSKRLALVFQCHGLKPNGKVTIISNNHAMFPVVLFATWLCGATANLLDPWVHQERVNQQLKMVNTDLVVCIPQVQNKVNMALEVCKQKAKVFLFEKEDNVDSTSHLNKTEKALVIKNIVNSSKKSSDSLIKVNPNNKKDVAAILWSSGSTGEPKGIAIPFSSFIAHLKGNIKLTEMTGTWLMSIWMFHSGSLYDSMTAIEDGVSLVYLQPDLVGPEELLQTINKFQCTFGEVSYHNVIRLMNERVEGPDVSCFKEVSPMGANLPLGSLQKLKKVFPNMTKCPDIYGSTEMGLVYGSQDATLGGVVYPFVEVKFINIATGELCEPFENGELCTRSPFLALGYVGNSTNFLDSDGYFKSGDIGYYDTDGHIFYTDRLKDLIKVGLHYVYSTEVESIIQKHPDIAEVGVFGIPDPKLGEVCSALVTTVPGSGVSEDQLKAWINDPSKVEAWKHVKHIKIVKKLPTNVIGKKVRKSMKTILDDLLSKQN